MTSRSLHDLLASCDGQPFTHVKGLADQDTLLAAERDGLVEYHLDGYPINPHWLFRGASPTDCAAVTVHLTDAGRHLRSAR
jgi:hypothetical protein